MSEEQSKVLWRYYGESVQGATHIQAELPNQDAVGWWPHEPGVVGSGLPVVMAVSDGHGSAKSFRSDVGSKLAVEVATEEIVRFFHLDQPNQEERYSNFQLINDQAKTRLPHNLVERWQKEALQHRQENPFTEEEINRLEAKEGLAAVRLVEAEQSSVAYGATLLTVLVTKDFILYLQLGDGDILCVDSNGRSTQPFPKDERLIANETTSLCLKNAWQEVRVRLVNYSDNPPELIMLSTDGYANSFATDEDFFRVGEEYFNLIRKQGVDYVAEQLKQFLENTSQNGSGDDITLGIITRITTELERVEKKLNAQIEELGEQMTQDREKLSNHDNQFNKFDKRVSNLESRTFFVSLLSLLSFFIACTSIGLQLFSNKSPKPATTSTQPSPVATSTKPEIKPAPANTETPSQQISEKEALELIKQWLQARNKIYSPPYDSKLADEVTTGNLHNEIISEGGEIERLKKDNASSSYKSEVKRVKSFLPNEDVATITAIVNENKEHFVGGKLDPNQSYYNNEITVAYTLKNVDNRWKVANRISDGSVNESPEQ